MDQVSSPTERLVEAINGKIGSVQLASYLRSKQSSENFAATLWGRYASLPKFAELVYSVTADSPEEAIVMAFELISGRSREAKEERDAVASELVAVPQEKAA